MPPLLMMAEHDMRVVAASDWVIDIGPRAGDEGARVVAAGTPVELSKVSESRTAIYLARFLNLAESSLHSLPRNQVPRSA
ncbi:hypothetical protein JAO29_02465 [Edaphobacter sp. HDX4]|uniref:hypothetical protein n=1 Tax=Edaphobacter sp. HDX4 TaxID=2794064 RepID=UPI002FE55A0E